MNRISVIATVLLTVLLAVSGVKSAFAQSAAKWVADCAEAVPPKSPVAGMLNGKPFKPEKVYTFTFHGYAGTKGHRAAYNLIRFSMYNGDKQHPDREIVIWLTAHDGELMDHLVFKAHSGKLAVQNETVGFKNGINVPRVQYIDVTDKVAGKPATQRIASGFSAIIRFGTQDKQGLDGSVYVALPDAAHSFAAGSFKFRIK
ncbi:MAG: hypothetical protein ABJA67_05580 [Chthonomonadales bacterium]